MTMLGFRAYSVVDYGLLKVFLDGMGKKQVIQTQNLGLYLRPCWISFSIFFHLILLAPVSSYIFLFSPSFVVLTFFFPLSCGSQEGGGLPYRRNIRSCPYLIQLGSPGAESFHGYDNFTVKTKMSVCLGILPKERHKWLLMVRPWSPTLSPVPGNIQAASHMASCTSVTLRQ